MITSNSVSTEDLSITADGAGAGNVGPFRLGSNFAGFSLSFTYAGAGTPSISVLVSNDKAAVVAAGRTLTSGLSKTSVYSSEAKYYSYWATVTGMAANDVAPLSVHLHRWV